MSVEIKQFLDELNDAGRSQFHCLEKIAKEVQPKRILEIGSGWGLSAVAFLRQTKATMTTIDPQPSLPEFDRRVTGMGVKKRVTRFVGRSGSPPPNPKYKNQQSNLVLKFKGKQKFDLIYVDGCHRYEEVKEDLLNCWDLVKKGGVMLLDDFFHKHNWSGKYGVARAVSEVAKEKNTQFIVYPAAHGVVRFNL
jgi:predicted O-methyltransferase YrrM